MFSETWSLASAAQQFKQGVLILSVIDMWGHIPLCFWGLYWVLHVYQHSWSLSSTPWIRLPDNVCVCTHILHTQHTPHL